jgi:hypothetical protein
MNALRPGLFNGERQHFRDPSMNAMRLKLQRSEKIRLLRADSGVFDDKLLSFFGTAPAALHCIGQAHSLGEPRRPTRVEQWMVLDDDDAAGELRLKLLGLSVERRFVVIRERVREGRDSARSPAKLKIGRRLESSAEAKLYGFHPSSLSSGRGSKPLCGCVAEAAHSVLEGVVRLWVC